MRKFFEGHSLIGVVIIISVFILAVFLRFNDLNSQGPWTDEIASWWYVRHLDTVFYRESHTPLFYGILRVFLGEDATISGIRHFVGAVSVIHLVEFFFLGQLALKKRAFLLFWVFVCLNPADIVHARMARQYSWLLEGVLVYFLLWKISAPYWLRLITGIFMCSLHLFVVIPVTILAAYDFYSSRNWKQFFLNLIPCFVPGIYYITRIISFGQNKVLENVVWNKSDFWTHLKLTLTQLFGDAFPRLEFYPVSIILATLLFILSMIPLIYFKKNSSRIFFLIFVFSFLTIEILTPWTNLRVSRYLIYLSGLWLFALSESLEDVKDYIFYPVLLAPVMYLFYFNPLLGHPWERERFEQWKEIKTSQALPQELVCMNIYQAEYYGVKHTACRELDYQIDSGKPLLFFDLNGTETYVISPLIKSMRVTEYIPLEKGGLIVRFDPKLNDKFKK